MFVVTMHWLELYYFSTTLNQYPEDREYVLSLLDSYEYERFERYKFDDSRWTFATARWMVKTQLAKHLDVDPASIQFCYNDNGKPFLSDLGRELEISISHTNSGIAVALSNHSCGVDLEGHVRRGEPWLQAKAFLNQHAAIHIDALKGSDEKKRCFSRYWTMMEAKVKWQGETLFTIKNQFAKHLPALYRDGVYQDQDALFFTAATANDEQLSVCVERKPKRAAVYAFNKSSWQQDLGLQAALFHVDLGRGVHA